MPYHPKVVTEVKKLPLTHMGAALGRWAIYFDLPVIKIAIATGATRQSVYNWMKGGEIFKAFKPRVLAMIKIMEQAHATNKTTEDVWRTICREFNLQG